jgi:hypothetical protein
VEISPEGVASLRKNSRQYVRATVRDEQQILSDVGVHLKGSTGSFRKLDDKPALTLDFGKFASGQRFHGLKKIHLNNSVEDPSYLNELLGAELFRAAGLPAPRVTHAVVELNGRRLGLYVLKEGFTPYLLAPYFRNPHGKFFDKDLDQNAGEPALEPLVAAVRTTDLAERWRELEQVLDTGRFVSFMAMEVIAGHRDGYCLARNNFRIYRDSDTGKILFFPHGMDQLFGNANNLIEPRMSGLVARAVMETPQGRQAYRERFAYLLTNAFNVSNMLQQVEQTVARLRPAVTVSEARALDKAGAVVQERIARRRLDLERQLRERVSALLRVEGEWAKLNGWRTVDVPANGSMARISSPDGKPCLAIRAGPVTSASWRTTVLLPKGRYRFEGAVSTRGVEPLTFGKNKGAALRVSGVRREAPADLAGDHGWTALAVTFGVTAPEQETELICELRAREGEAWFDLNSLRVVRLEK